MTATSQPPVRRLEFGEPAPSGQLAPKTPSFRLFYAEDNSINQRVLGAILKRLGLACQMCNNGAHLLQALQNQQADLIFMDIQMPELDGVEATRRIRSGEVGLHNSGVPIIGLSAFARMGDANGYAAAGMTAYYDKPINAETIRGVLSDFDLLPPR